MFDLIAFSETTTNNGYAGVAVAAGEDFYGYSGDDLYIQDDGRVIFSQFIDATTTKGARARFKSKSMADWCEMTGCSLDSGLRMPGFYYQGVPLKAGDILNVNADNSNTNEITNVLLGYQKGRGRVTMHPSTPIPDGAIWVKLIGTTACVAITWTDLLASTSSYNFQRDRDYKVLGMASTSAAGLAARLKFKTGSSADAMKCRPGVPASYELTEVNGPVLYFNDMDLVFNGLNPPTVQGLDTTTSASFKTDLLVLPL